MPSTPLPRPSLRSRFGRRLLVLFMVCSLVPMTVFAVLSFSTVTRQLQDDSLGRLEHTGRALAGVVTERLRFLSRDLEQVTPRPAPCADAGADDEGPACDGSLLYGLTALRFAPDSGQPVQYFGRAAPLPVLEPLTRRALEAGRSVVVAGVPGNRSVIYLVRRVAAGRAGGGLLVAEVYAAYLWGTPEENPLVPTMQLHVVDDSGRVLFSSTAGPVRLPGSVRRNLGARRAGAFEWTLEDERYLAACSPIDEPPEVATPRWTLIASEDQAAVIAPMAQFRRTFPLVALAALGVALLLSFSQLRRNLRPLRALQEGTRRLATQQFDQPVVVSSGDEFEDLALSFNTMAGEIARQFAARVTVAEVDQAVLSSVDTKRIVGTVLARMGDVCLCDFVAVTLVDAPSGESATTYTTDYGAPETHPHQAGTRRAARLRDHPDGLPLGDTCPDISLRSPAAAPGRSWSCRCCTRASCSAPSRWAAWRSIGRGKTS